LARSISEVDGGWNARRARRATADRLRLSKINAAEKRTTKQESERTSAEYSRQLHPGPPPVQRNYTM
jgi:hypothetical protein